MAKIRVARLGEGDVFLGLEEIDAADFDAAVHVDAAEFGGACDNAPGQYTWNRAEKRFHPVLNDWDRDFGALVLAGLELAQANLEAEGAIGAAARRYHAACAKRFPHVMALHVKNSRQGRSR